MKQKNMKYVLIAGVLLIWTLVVVRVIKGMAQDKIPALTMSTITSMPVLTDKDSFSLFANYDDPFLRQGGEETEIADSVIINPTPIPFKAKVHLPVAYHGSIINPATKKKIALVMIRNIDYSLKEKEK